MVSVWAIVIRVVNPIVDFCWNTDTIWLLKNAKVFFVDKLLKTIARITGISSEFESLGLIHVLFDLLDLHLVENGLMHH